MNWTSLDTWILITGALAAASCALLGTYLVLRRMSMMGDAISHAVLPGLALAFLITGSRSTTVMFVGAAVVGLLTAVLSQAVHRWGRVDPLASMGVVFTSLFALGLLLIVRAADRVDLDPGCVLYGALELTPLLTVDVLGWEIPRAALVLAVIGGLDVLFVVALYHPLKISSFDPALADTLGFPSGWLHHGLMAMVAMTTVAAFEAVGSILVVAMLIVPGATALLLSSRLRTVLLLSVGLSVVGAVIGHLGAIAAPAIWNVPDLNIGAAMVVATGLLFVLALLFAPRHGMISRVRHQLALSVRIAREDLLGLLYRLEESGESTSRDGALKRLRETLGLHPALPALALRGLRRRQLVRAEPGQLVMTDAGRAAARDLVRSHRLWEAYLLRNLDVPADHVHPTAMQLEHITGSSLRAQLARDVGDTDVDPHGRPIPGG